MKRSKLLTIPRAATRMLLATLLLALTAQTAWASDLTSANLLIDSEITEGTAGHYYYTMPRVCNNTLTITEQDISDGKGTFNVYDCGGKNHDQDWYNLNEALVITAPLGYAVKITGTAKTDDNQYKGSEYLSVYDGTSTSGAYLGRFGTTSHSEYYNVDVQSSSNSIMLEFVTSMWNIKGRGLNLTVSLVEVQYSISIATINIEKYHRYTGSAVDLGYTVDDSKGNRLTQGTHYNATIKNNNGEVVQSAISEGHYTLTIEGISPYSGSKTVDFWVNENPGVLIDSDIAEGTLGHFFSLMPKSGSATVDLTQSDVATLMIYDDGGKGGGYDSNTPGNFTPKANGYLLLHAPAGFQIHLTGHVRTKSAKAYLTVHNGNTESAPTLCANVHGVNSSAGTSTYKDVTVDVISTGEYMLLHFDAGALTWGWDSEGLILTASIGHSITVDDGITHGSVSCDNFWIKGSSTTIPLTVTPDVGYSVNTVSYNDDSDHTLTPDVNGDYSFTMPDTKVTVNATFAPITYTVSFNANGGTGDAMATQNFTYDAAQNLTANTYTRTGYTFAGWATTADGDVAYADGAEVSNLAMTQGANVELYAKWTANTYYVHFNANDGTGTMDNEEFTYDAVAKALTANTFTRTGYTFAGWATAADGAVAYVDQAEVSNLTATANGIFDLYAKWTENIATLTEANPIAPLTAMSGKQTKVRFERTGLTAGKYSTICLPYDFTASETCTFYTFVGVKKEGDDWVAGISAHTGTLAANTPYIFTTATATSVTFSNDAVTAAASYDDASANTSVTDWTFQGTYSQISLPKTDEYDYGFAAGDGSTVAIGTFVHLKSGASAAPFRAYLKYTGSDDNWAKAPNRAGAANDAMPSRIIVRIVGADGSTTAIGTLDTRTGEISTGDYWYSLDGHRLQGKPTTKGIYIHNGRKEVLK